MLWINKLVEYLQYPFVIYALIVGMLISLCSALLGVVLVLRRLTFIGDSLSHVSFTASTVASILKLSFDTIIVLPVTLIFTVLFMKPRHNSRINGDSLVAIISVASLAIGYLIINLFSTSANIASDVCAVLFGSASILTLTQTDVITCIVLSVIVIVFFILFYNKIFTITFDETFARATGVNVNLYNTVFAIIVASVIVLSMDLVGALLITALIALPAVSAMRIFKSFRTVTIFSAIFSIVCSTLGILVSIVAGTPVGSTIVVSDTAGFILCYFTGFLLEHRVHIKSTLAACVALVLMLSITGCSNSNSPKDYVLTEDTFFLMLTNLNYYPETYLNHDLEFDAFTYNIKDIEGNDHLAIVRKCSSGFGCKCGRDTIIGFLVNPENSNISFPEPKNQSEDTNDKAWVHVKGTMPSADKTTITINSYNADGSINPDKTEELQMLTLNVSECTPIEDSSGLAYYVTK